MKPKTKEHLLRLENNLDQVREAMGRILEADTGMREHIASWMGRLDAIYTALNAQQEQLDAAEQKLALVSGMLGLTTTNHEGQDDDGQQQPMGD